MVLDGLISLRRFFFLGGAYKNKVNPIELTFDSEQQINNANIRQESNIRITIASLKKIAKLIPK